MNSTLTAKHSKGRLTIGRVAKLSGVGVETIRFYQRERILEEPPRVESGFREYDEEIIKKLRFIKRAQELGFSLKEISELLSLRVTKRGTCDAVAKRASLKLTQVQEKIADMKRIESGLLSLRKVCESRIPTQSCPILESFYEKECC